MTDGDRTRRRYLTTLAAASAWVAGCLGGDTPPETADRSTAPGGTGGDATTTAPSATTATTDRTTTTATDATTTTTTPIHPGYEYETTAVVVRTPGGDRLGAVTAAIADTGNLRYWGLSKTPSLPEDRGMLFVYDSVGRHTYVMRRMSFGIDIVFADDEGVITRIHHAPEPGPGEDGSDQEYPGRGQYVLEVNYGWTTDRGVGTGDVLHFEL